MNKLARVTFCVMLLTGVGATPVAQAALIFDDGFNFRSTRYNKPLRFDGDPNIIVFGGTITDSGTGLPPTGATVRAINSNPRTGETTPFVTDLRPFNSTGGFSTSVDYDPQLATGQWEVVVENDSGPPSGFILPGFGIGPGTGPIPDVVTNLTVDTSGVPGSGPVMNWNVPANLGDLNDGNIDRQRIRHLDSNGATLLDLRLPEGSSLSTETFTLPNVTHDGLYQTAVLVEGLSPFIRSETYTDFVVDGIGTGGTPIDISSTFYLRDNRQVNSVRFGQGDSLSVGVNIEDNGPNNTDVFNTFAYAKNRDTDELLALTRAGDIPTEFSSNYDFDPNLTGAWDVFIDNGEHNATVAVGDPISLQGKDSLEFVRNLTLTTSATEAPILSWTLPVNSPHDVIDIGLFNDVDDSRIPLGENGGLFDRLASANETSYQFDADIFGAGGLDPDGKYVARVILRSVFGNGVSSRSLSFVNFTPSLDTGGQAVFIPTIDDQGVFHFDIDVEALQTIPLDPFVAIGYRYAIGAGDPLFASVSLPMVGGDSEFLVEYIDALGMLQQIVLNSGTVLQFLHPTTGQLVGVEDFTVLGIDPSVGLDPVDVTAFVTDVQFLTAGQFTGTMTPITLFVDEASVLEPAPLALVGMGLLLVVPRRRRDS